MYRREFELVLELLVPAVKEVYGSRLVSLAVFGSVGRGTPRPDSDIDLLLVAENLPRGRMKRMAEFARVEEKMQQESSRFTHIVLDLSPVIKEKQEVLQGSLLFLDMVDDVKILYDRGKFLARYLARLREKLQQLGARKIYHGGAWYWVLKKDYKQGEVIEI
ncbi:putative nucleotidyltransferase [Desulfofundulus luciae]|uniref:Nucleotidyltransferase n=1 Tax=Desulfofundulus luciae TaxID=74702 RepID=A0ABU0AYR7_9FIRM|nr:nucleotidyltransferase domain-containing protein [Desulfofundulus luciae]MDQ0285602.1 putative nucleotidyltransferase [Desulfofundulus luciae]